MSDIWDRIGGDDRLQNARRKLSFHELRLIIRHAADQEREKIMEELEAMALEQEASNERNPDHAATYESWRSRPEHFRMAAFKIGKSLPSPKTL